MTDECVVERRLLLHPSAAQRLLDDHRPKVVGDDPTASAGPKYEYRSDAGGSNRHGNDQRRLHGFGYYKLSV